MSKDDLIPIERGGDARENEAYARKLAEMLSEVLPAKFGFTLFVFDVGKDGSPGHVSYISNADRADMIAAIRGWLKQAAP